VAQLKQAGVESVFISIPNMDALCESRNPLVLSNEHTYFVGEREATNLFAEFGFARTATQFFRKHSSFFLFKNDPSCTFLPWPPSEVSNSSVVLSILDEFKSRMAALRVSSPFFICPAGMYGQLIYKHLGQNEPLLEGFLDNDTAKQGHRVYGSPKHVSPVSILSDLVGDVAVLMFAGIYSTELKAQISSLNPRAVIVTI
jgi:hypothetical protein